MVFVDVKHHVYLLSAMRPIGESGRGGGQKGLRSKVKTPKDGCVCVCGGGGGGGGEGGERERASSALVHPIHVKNLSNTSLSTTTVLQSGLPPTTGKRQHKPSSSKRKKKL